MCGLKETTIPEENTEYHTKTNIDCSAFSECVVFVRYYLLVHLSFGQIEREWKRNANEEEEEEKKRKRISHKAEIRNHERATKKF